jgi:hypothetical protein
MSHSGWQLALRHFDRGLTQKIGAAIVSLLVKTPVKYWPQTNFRAEGCRWLDVSMCRPVDDQ